MKKFPFYLFPLAILLSHSLSAQTSKTSPQTVINQNPQTTSPSTQSTQPPSITSAKKPVEQKDDEIVFFTPPPNWLGVDPNMLPEKVKVMVIGKGPNGFPPSLNLSWENYSGTLKDYLKIVKNLNTAHGYEWKDLGTIQTQAGIGSLSQVDTQTQWGNVRLMHVILKKNGKIYILTASALKNEFAIFYKDFFSAMRSLKIAKDEYEMIANPLQRSQLKTAADKLKTQWQTLLVQKQKQNPHMNIEEIQNNLFNSPEFQNTIWTPFQDMLKQKYNQNGAEWQSLFLQKLEDQLFKTLNQ